METAQLLKILPGWAVTLSSYPAPEHLPTVEYKTESYFHEHACGGRPFSILAWYDNNGAIYLQDISGRYDNSSCEDHARREQETYAIQREYGIRASGSILYIRMVIPPCPQAL